MTIPTLIDASGKRVEFKSFSIGPCEITPPNGKTITLTRQHTFDSSEALSQWFTGLVEAGATSDEPPQEGSPQ